MWDRNSGKNICTSNRIAGGNKCAFSGQVNKLLRYTCETGQNACKLDSAGGKTCAKDNGLDEGCATVNAAGKDYPGHCGTCKNIRKPQVVF